LPLSPGFRLGPYEIIAPLGAGGMGEVYRARDPRLGREIAIKVLPSSFSGDADRLRRLRLTPNRTNPARTGGSSRCRSRRTERSSEGRIWPGSLL